MKRFSLFLSQVNDEYIFPNTEKYFVKLQQAEAATGGVL